jgi:hypothetical protein
MNAATRLCYLFDLDEGKSEQEVVVSHAAVDGASWIVLVAIIGAATTLCMRTVLARAARIAVGSVALIDDNLVMRHAIRLESFSAGELDRVAKLIACEAASLRLTGRAHGAEGLFDAFSE